MSAVSEQYAVALFELALESNQVVAIKDAFAVFLDQLDDDAKTFFYHPNIDKSSKQAVVSKSGYPSLFKDFLKVVIHNNRMQALNDVKKAFDKLSEDEDAVMTLDIYTAKPLKDAQKKALEETYGKKYNRQIIVRVTIDDKIHGGMRIEYNGMVLNDTVQSSLNKLKSRLMK